MPRHARWMIPRWVAQSSTLRRLRSLQRARAFLPGGTSRGFLVRECVFASFSGWQRRRLLVIQRGLADPGDADTGTARVVMSGVVVDADVEGPMKSLIMAIVQALVDKPEEVQIKEVIGEHAHVLELRVAKEDLGKVIGKGGAHASAIRTLMAAASGKEKKRYILEIIEY